MLCLFFKESKNKRPLKSMTEASEFPLEYSFRGFNLCGRLRNSYLFLTTLPVELHPRILMRPPLKTRI